MATGLDVLCPFSPNDLTWFMDSHSGLYYVIYEKNATFLQAQTICSHLLQYRLAVFDNIRYRMCQKEETITLEPPSMMPPVTPEEAMGCAKGQDKGENNGTLVPLNNVTTEEELLKAVKAIRNHLIVNRSRLSSTLRKKTSAQDYRYSAQATGCVGLLILLVLFFPHRRPGPHHRPSVHQQEQSQRLI
ncbi:hypothetical protein ACOMHN_031030 [Nucella lapillus]